MKIIKSNLSLYLTIFLVSFFLIFSKNTFQSRELIILLDILKDESIETTLNTSLEDSLNECPQGIGAISLTLLIALHQEAAPILVHKSLVKNIVDHKNLFLDFANNNLYDLKKKYINYKNLNNSARIEKFKENSQYSYNTFNKVNNEIKNLINDKTEKLDMVYKLSANNNFNEYYAPKNLKYSKDKIKNLNTYREQMIYAICACSPLNNYITKDVNQDLCLLIPKKYLNNLNLNINFKLETKDNKIITNSEYSLGLKINHLDDIENIEKIKINKDTSNKDFTSNLNKIFIAKNLYKKNDTQPNWIIYISGHGLPISNKNCLLKQLIKLENSSDKNCLNLIKEEINQIQHDIQDQTEFDKGIIASMSKEDFQKMLKFFNDSINTKFLYYTSCFSGGDLLIEPYQESNKPLILNYPVVTGTIAENMSIQDYPELKIPPYKYINKDNNILVYGLPDGSIDFHNKKLTLMTTLHFEDFFKSIKTDRHLNIKNLHKILHNLHPHKNNNGEIKYESVGNIPSYRKAYSDYFNVVPYDSAYQVITDNYLKNIKIEKIKLKKEIALLYSDHINKPIIIQNKSKFCPIFISMIPGLAAHKIDKIMTKKFNLCDIIYSFLFFPELSASKIFWIKKLICKNNSYISSLFNNNSEHIIFHDLIIMRNIYNQDNLYYSNNSLNGFTCAYLTESKSKTSYRINVKDLEMIDDQNLEFNICNSANYKNDLIALNSNLKNYLNYAIA